MRKYGYGFTLIELITVTILIGILSAALFSRFSSNNYSSVLSSRDDIIAALFFAQQQAMMRSSATNPILVVFAANSVSVTESGAAIKAGSDFYPLQMPSGITITSSSPSFTYDKLGRTAAGTISISGRGGVSASIRVEASGYAFAN